MLTTIASAVPAAVLASPSTAGPFGPQDDPIFAAIEAHRVARQKYLRMWESAAATDEQLDPLCDEMDRTMERLTSTEPKTIEGALAFLRYRREHEIAVEGAEAVERDQAWQVIEWTERALAGMFAAPLIAAV